MAADIAHSVESASHEAGLHPKTVRECIHRYDKGEFHSEIDEQVCTILARARALHIAELRRKGEIAGGDVNGPGVAWYKWRLETQAPKEHPRKTEVELAGKNGGPIQTADLSQMSTEQLRELLRETEPTEED